MELLVNQRIKDLRKSLKLNQSEFAKTLGVTQTTICNVESGKAGYSIELLKNIAETYNIDIIYFFEKDTKKEKSKTADFSFEEKLIQIKFYIMGKFGIKKEQWDETLDELFSAKFRVYSSFQK